MRSRTLSPGAFRSAHIGADRIDDGFRALRHFDGFFAGDVALVVITIAKQDDGAPNRRSLGCLQQFVAAGKVNRVVEGSAATGPKFVNAVREFLRIVGKILRNFWGHIESDDECMVGSRMNRLVQEFDRGFLFELKAVADGIAGINEQTYFERQVGFRVEASNLLRRFVVINNGEIALLQVGNTAAVLVGHGEYNVHFVGGNANGEDGVISRCVGISRLLLLIRAGRT